MADARLVASPEVEPRLSFAVEVENRLSASGAGAVALGYFSLAWPSVALLSQIETLLERGLHELRRIRFGVGLLCDDELKVDDEG